MDWLTEEVAPVEMSPEALTEQVESEGVDAG